MSDTERYSCDRCGDEFDSIELIPLEISLTSETWDLCDSCIGEFVRWAETETERSEGTDNE